MYPPPPAPPPTHPPPHLLLLQVVKILVDPLHPDLANSALQEELELFPPTVPILNLLIVNADTHEPKLIVLSADRCSSSSLSCSCSSTFTYSSSC